VKIVEEPVAHGDGSDGAQRVAVRGRARAGTSTAPIIDCTSRPARVIRHAGDPYLGSDDIDHALAKWTAIQCSSSTAGTASGCKGLQSPRSPLRTSHRQLMRRGRWSILESTLQRQLPQRVRIDRATRGCCAAIGPVPVVRRVLREAGLQHPIFKLCLAGGNTLPLVRDSVAGSPASALRVRPDEVVAVGAACSARNVMRSRCLSRARLLPFATKDAQSYEATDRRARIELGDALERVGRACSARWIVRPSLLQRA
jgi:hypothetical protein